MAAVASSVTHPPSHASAEANNVNGFSAVNKGLIVAGAVGVARYLDDANVAPTASSTPAVSSRPPIVPFAPESEHHTVPRAVKRLHEACQNTFGSSEALNFEYEGNPPGMSTCMYYIHPRITSSMVQPFSAF